VDGDVGGGIAKCKREIDKWIERKREGPKKTHAVKARATTI